MKIQPLLLTAFIFGACEKKQSVLIQITQNHTSPEYRKAEYYYDSTDKRDSAFLYFYNVSKNLTDSVLAANAYAYMAIIQQDVGDFVGVQESALAGLQLLNEDSLEQKYSMGSLYNILGRSNVGLRNYDQAIGYYNQAIKVVPDLNYQNTYRNNVAVALREKGSYKEALDSLLSIPVSKDEDKRSFARRTTNIASLKWKIDSNYNPLPDLHTALKARLEDNDKYGVTASYNHLSNYYRAINTDSALYFSKKMYASALETNGTDDQLEALRKLIALSPPVDSKNLFKIYQNLNDSVQFAQNAAKNQYAVIRFETEKRKKENLLLQEENAQKKLQILRQRILTYGSISVALLIVTLAIWRYRKKRQQTRIEAQAAIKENQLKISQKIHDNVANGLYRVMTEIEHVETIDRESLLDKIEDLYERSRDISYDQVDKEKDTTLHISQLLTSFATPDTKISVVGNKEELWKDIPSMIVKELEQVLQELMVNMKKHSSARYVVLHFSKTDNHLSINYKDDGQGFPSNFRKGNGLKSTGIRINRIGGEITFAEQTANGAAINILIPILSNDQKSINS